MDDLPELRATVPALEPDDVLLGQLVELSAASTAAVRRRTLRPARALSVGAAAFGLVAATSWIAGALPGVPSPLAPTPAPHPTPSAPASPSHTTDVRIPGADVGPTSGASGPHTEAPGVDPAQGPTTGPGSPTWAPPGRPSSTPSGGAGGRGVGQSSDKHPDQGKHLGSGKQHRTRSPRPKQHHTPTASPPTTRPTARPTSGHSTGP